MEGDETFSEDLSNYAPRTTKFAVVTVVREGRDRRVLVGQTRPVVSGVGPSASEIF